VGALAARKASKRDLAEMRKLLDTYQAENKNEFS
jgi:N-acetylglutamate synthase-like GNAT family acetyltransferase